VEQALLKAEESRQVDINLRQLIESVCTAYQLTTTEKEFGDYLGDPVITAATVDRMVHHPVIITI
jgi:hypothetical protein